MAPGVADAPAVELGLQAEAVSAHSGEHVDGNEMRWGEPVLPRSHTELILYGSDTFHNVLLFLR